MRRYEYEAMGRIGALIVGIVLCIVVAASADDSCSAREWDRVFTEFGLQVVDEVPAGVTPLVVSSPGQVRKLLGRNGGGRVEVNIETSNLQQASARSSASEMLALTETYIELHVTDTHEYPVVFHLYAKVWLAGSGSFWQITDCDDRVYFTGWLPWCGHDNEWSSSHIALNYQSVEVEGGARFYGYILVPGIGEVWVYTYQYHLETDYSLY